MNNLQIAEHGRIYKDKIGEKAFAELVDFAHGDGNDKFIGFINSHTLKAKNFVGLIQTKSGFVLEILPKIFDRGKDDEFKNDEKDEAQKLLIKMLKTLKNSRFKQTQMANLQTKKNFPLLEIFANMFLDELDIIIKSGIKNSYVAISQNRHFLKGKLLFNEHLKQNLTHKERFYTNADEFIADIPENRIIVSALNLLFGFGFGVKTNARLTRAKFIFSDISESKNLDSDFAKCLNSRHFNRYEAVLAWCRVFLKKESFTQYSGSQKAFALLFDMNLLFESFVGRCFKKFGGAWEIKLQSRQRYLLKDENENNISQMKPDILATNGEKCVILDTKWKIIDKVSDISQGDLYQIFAYSEKFKSAKNVLIYPKIGDFNGETKYFYKANNKELEIFFFDLSDENLIKLQIQTILGGENER